MVKRDRENSVVKIDRINIFMIVPIILLANPGATQAATDRLIFQTDDARVKLKRPHPKFQNLLCTSLVLVMKSLSYFLEYPLTCEKNVPESTYPADNYSPVAQRRC